MKKKKFAVIDTETIGGLAFPRILDIGIAICDKDGDIYETLNLLCREGLQRLMYEEIITEENPNAFWTPQKKQWYYDKANTSINVMDWQHCCRFIDMLLHKHHITTIMAYNLQFDKRAIANSNAHFLGYNFLKEYEEQCIWGMACETICNTKKYQDFCLRNNLYSASGKNISTNAENVYRFISNNLHHIEAHNALSDAIEEAKIFAYCLASRKRYTKGIVYNPWRIPQPRQRE